MSPVDTDPAASWDQAGDPVAARPHVIVLFGATGDLSRRKLLPGLLRLSHAGLMPECAIVGTSLEELDDEAFQSFAYEACREFARHDVVDAHWSVFQKRLRFVSQAHGPEALARVVDDAEASLGGDANRLHYLSIPPNAAEAVVRTLGEARLADRSRIIMEKPFGTDLSTAKVLNESVHGVFTPDQVYRIDHFLGKEAAQNILAFRFANGLFEPIWNRGHIDHIQIDVPETLSVDTRASFYETTGAFRDMVVTHLFQVMAFMAMEPPTSLEPRAINEEKNKVFRGRPTTARPRPSSPSSARSTTGAGPACPSTCGPARTWPRAPGSSRSPSGSRRRACSPPARASGPTGPTT
jgi:glucose-6-phosphate 1-dehydrogenase